MIKINNKTISSVYDETTSIEKIMKGTLLVYEAFKKLIASGVPPITLQKCKGANLVDYKIYGNGVINNILPSEYQQLEYIQNSGKEYIDTGIIPTNNTSVDITYQTDRINASQYIIGSRETTNSVIGYGINGSQSRSDWSVLLNGTTSTPMYSNVERNSNKWRIQLNIENGTGTWELTDLDENSTTVIDVTNKQVIATTPLNLFAFHTSNIHPSLKVYECKIYENKTLVRHFVPCYRKEDDEIGMYDLVNNVFYTNDGTGAFLKGDNTPIEVESVGEKTNNYTYPTSPNDVNGKGIKAEIVGDKFHIYGYPATDVGVWVVLNYNKNNIPAGNYYGKMIIKPRSTNLNSEILNYTHWGGFVNDTHFGFYGGAKVTIDTLTSLYLYITASGDKLFKDGEYIDIDVEFMLNKGSTGLPYEPYGYKIPIKVSDELGNETTTNIYLNEPLRKIGNYVDYIDYKNKEVVRIVNKKTFDGTENWERHTTISGGAVFRIDNALTPLIGVPQTSTFMTHFDLTNIYSTASFKTGLYRFSSSSTEIVNITGDRLYVSSSNTTVEDFKEWLSINKPSIYYPITTPTKETIESPNIPLNKGTNIIEVDTNILPSNMEIKYIGKE